jgi:hypothetical protein
MQTGKTYYVCLDNAHLRLTAARNTVAESMQELRALRGLFDAEDADALLDALDTAEHDALAALANIAAARTLVRNKK